MAGLMIGVAILAFFSHSKTAAAERDQVRDHMTASLEVTDAALSDWIVRHQLMATGWANSGTIPALAQGLLEVSPTRSTLLASPEHTEISSQLAVAPAIEEYPSYSIIDHDGLILSSNLEDDVGTQWGNVAEEDLLKGVWEGTVRFRMADSRPLDPTDAAMIHIPSLIRTADGEAVAALVFTVDPADGFSDVLGGGT